MRGQSCCLTCLYFRCCSAVWSFAGIFESSQPSSGNMARRTLSSHVARRALLKNSQHLWLWIMPFLVMTSLIYYLFDFDLWPLWFWLLWLWPLWLWVQLWFWKSDISLIMNLIISYTHLQIGEHILNLPASKFSPAPSSQYWCAGHRVLLPNWVALLELI